MRDTDFTRFTALLDDIAGVLPNAKPFSPAGKSLFFRALAGYRIDDVERGLMAHVADPQRGRFLPAPADVIAQIEGAAANDGRPGADEAWALAYRAADEAETVIWTEETAQALAAAWPVLQAGDKVGARMAFKGAYDRLVAEARQRRRPARWVPSLGQDPQRRTQALLDAQTQGLLPGPVVVGLLTGPSQDENVVDSHEARQLADYLLQALAKAVSPMEKQRQHRERQAERERERLKGLKAEAEFLAGPAAPIWPVADLSRRPS